MISAAQPACCSASAVLVKLIRWVIFTVLFSLLPIFISYIVATVRDADNPSLLASVVSHGELYLLASSFSAVGLGEIIGVNQKWQISKIIVSGLSLLSLVLSIGLYVYLNYNQDQKAILTLTSMSYWTFSFSCVVSSACIALSEIKDA